MNEGISEDLERFRLKNEETRKKKGKDEADKYKVERIVTR